MPDQEPTFGAASSNSRASKKRRPRGESPTKPAVLARRERDAEAVRLRRNGMTFDAIARALGYADSSHAHTALLNHMQRYPKESTEDARQLECDRLDAAQAAIWARCLDSQDSNQHWALDRFLKISDQRARLMGLNKPVRQEITVLAQHTVSDAIVALQRANEEKALAAGVALPALRAAAEVINVERA